MSPKQIIVRSIQTYGGLGCMFLNLVMIFRLCKRRNYDPIYIDHPIDCYNSRWCDILDYEKPVNGIAIRMFSFMPMIAMKWKTPPGNKMIQKDIDELRPFAQSISGHFTMDVQSVLNQYPQIKDSICVYFRGSDKNTESSRPIIKKYQDYLNKFSSSVPFWIQSDEQSIIDEFKTLYPYQAWSLPFITTSKNGQPLHIDSSIDQMKEIALLMMLMSSSKFFVGNISNISHSVILIRKDNNYFYIE